MITATIVGGKKLLARLAVAKVSVAKGGDDAGRIAAEYVAEYAADFSAWDTGATSMNVRVETASYGFKVIADRGGDHPLVPIYLEYGTSKMSARPFMQPAVDLVVGSQLVSSEIRTTGGLLRRA